MRLARRSWHDARWRSERGLNLGRGKPGVLITLVNVPGAAHLLPLEQPETAASHMIGFVRAVGTKLASVFLTPTRCAWSPSSGHLGSAWRARGRLTLFVMCPMSAPGPNSAVHLSDGIVCFPPRSSGNSYLLARRQCGCRRDGQAQQGWVGLRRIIRRRLFFRAFFGTHRRRPRRIGNHIAVFRGPHREPLSRRARLGTGRDRKRAEMLFAHLKRILRLGRLRLRGPPGAQFEFTLAAIAQNLRRLARIVARSPPLTDPCVA